MLAHLLKQRPRNPATSVNGSVPFTARARGSLVLEEEISRTSNLGPAGSSSYFGFETLNSQQAAFLAVLG